MKPESPKSFVLKIEKHMTNLNMVQSTLCLSLCQEYSLFKEHHPLESNLCLHPEKCDVVHRSAHHEP